MSTVEQHLHNNNNGMLMNHTNDLSKKKEQPIVQLIFGIVDAI